ncbi:glycosyltransferase [Wenjunlia vitaminophila]|uniref:D-inositol 3-phosphate glycosyltransferase n=1 Tax=Wenjunlia vitaminophila TaxID=76728 RepID=A0A0T6LVD5_WENVI|nr:glycosyltransferase family 4 protein [Wenjunlia vitaminophila]KRV49663.1 glycosyltransferase [Wenjunlia vitaminophila]
MNTTTSAGLGQLHAVQVLDDGTGCGVGAHVSSLARGLVARGVEVTVCGPVRAESAHQFTKEGIGFRTVEFGGSTSARDEAAALAVLRYVSGSAGVVHAHGLRAGVLASLALRRLRSRRRRVPLVVTLHGGVAAPEPGRRLLALVERRVIHTADLVLGASSDLVGWARAMGARDARLSPVAAPQPPATGQDAVLVRRRVRAELGVGSRPLLLTVGSLVPRQRFTELLDAARDWRELDPRPLLVVVGEGEELGRLQQRIDAEGLPVRLLGRRDDVPDLLTAADAVVLSGGWEGRSLIVQEALRGGTPLVSTAVGGVPELVGDAAVLVPDGDTAALARAVAGLVTDPARRAALAELGRVQATTWPNEDDTVTQVLSVYDELTQARVR